MELQDIAQVPSNTSLVLATPPPWCHHPAGKNLEFNLTNHSFIPSSLTKSVPHISSTRWWDCIRENIPSLSCMEAISKARTVISERVRNTYGRDRKCFRLSSQLKDLCQGPEQFCWEMLLFSISLSLSKTVCFHTVFCKVIHYWDFE